MHFNLTYHICAVHIDEIIPRTDGENILKYLIRVRAKLASRDVPSVRGFNNAAFL